MSKLPIISGMEAIKAFSRVPKHKELKPGLLRDLIEAAGLTVEEFEKLL